ncbi:Protein TIC 214 [Liparis tanakae]|uniref:Protein TIC 214 n=1 Tax=Liparis tanakae TaxID=230148 RepID=A0A4Z2I5Y0_9TELE|nr:Protein TIC 214 [Liparis tanakae]
METASTPGGSKTNKRFHHNYKDAYQSFVFGERRWSGGRLRREFGSSCFRFHLHSPKEVQEVKRSTEEEVKRSTEEEEDKRSTEEEVKRSTEEEDKRSTEEEDKRSTEEEEDKRSTEEEDKRSTEEDKRSTEEEEDKRSTEEEEDKRSTEEEHDEAQRGFLHTGFAALGVSVLGVLLRGTGFGGRLKVDTCRCDYKRGSEEQVVGIRVAQISNCDMERFLERVKGLGSKISTSVPRGVVKKTSSGFARGSGVAASKTGSGDSTSVAGVEAAAGAAALGAVLPEVIPNTSVSEGNGLKMSGAPGDASRKGSYRLEGAAPNGSSTSRNNKSLAIGLGNGSTAADEDEKTSGKGDRKGSRGFSERDESGPNGFAGFGARNRRSSSFDGESKELPKTLGGLPERFGSPVRSKPPPLGPRSRPPPSPSNRSELFSFSAGGGCGVAARTGLNKSGEFRVTSSLK